MHVELLVVKSAKKQANKAGEAAIVLPSLIDIQPYSFEI